MTNCDAKGMLFVGHTVRNDIRSHLKYYVIAVTSRVYACCKTGKSAVRMIQYHWYNFVLAMQQSLLLSLAQKPNTVFNLQFGTTQF